MPAGSVIIAPDGSETKSGLAEAIYDARIAMLANVIPPGVVPAGPAGFPLKNGIAVGANADASAIFTYLLANGEATGTIKMWSGAAAPSGYLLCDGSAVSRATYADLFAVCGTAFGAGNGTTTFNLPDLRGRVPLGAGTGDAADATAHTLGSKSGTETVTLNTTQIPAHAHSITDPGHKHTDDAGGTGFVVQKTGLGTPAIGAGSDYVVETRTGSATTGVTTGNLGGSGAHSNMPPTLAVNWIVKT